MIEANPRLPVNPDRDAARATAHRSKRAHLSWANIVLVGLGGTVGTGLRYLISTVVPDWAQVPVATFGINVLGALLLGVLLELLADRSLDTGWSRRIRLGIGTGLLGGFTTYSALTTETVVLAAAHPDMAAAYAMATVVLGGAASIAGIWLSRGQLRPTLVDAVTRR